MSQPPEEPHLSPDGLHPGASRTPPSTRRPGRHAARRPSLGFTAVATSVALVLLGPGAATAQLSQDSLGTADFERLESAAPAAVGHAWSVTGPDGAEASGAAGRAAPDGRPLIATDAFRVYSVVKPMTAAALGRLLERGAIAGDQDVRTLVPSFAPPEGVVTLMQLATHRGGVRHYRDPDEALGPEPCHTLEDALSIFRTDSLVAEPGTAESYSSWGFVLLSAAIAEASGAPTFEEAIAELVFEPAGMTGMRRPAPGDSDGASAGTWTVDESSSVLDETRQDLSCKYGAGGFVASPVDLARFGRALIDGTLLSDRTVDLFFRGGSTFVAQGIGPGGVAVLAVNRHSGWTVATASNTSGPGMADRLRAAAVATLEELSAGSGGT